MEDLRGKTIVVTGAGQGKSLDRRNFPFQMARQNFSFIKKTLQKINSLQFHCS